MYGFQLIINGQSCGRQENVLHYKNVECRNYMIKKFENDKCFLETEELLIMLDGVVLNKFNLTQQYPSIDWGHTIQQMYYSLGDTFFSYLRGSFAGAIYDKKDDKLIAFTDQLGSKFIYYTYQNGIFCCSEMMGEMYYLLQEQGIKYSLSSYATKVMLTYGFMIEDYTLCEQIKKIEPGSYLVLKDKKIEIQKYYILDNTPDETDLLEESVLEEVDRLFRQAVKRQFEKDKEYGYKHLCALSGGLDCRMTAFVAHDLGYTKQLNCTFSHSGYMDQTIPQEMAAFLKHEWIFKALDNGMWLYDVDEVTYTTGGNVLYYGTAHANSLLKYINFDHLGLMHSGQLGDVVISSKTNINDKDDAYNLGEGAYSLRFLDSLTLSPAMRSMKKELGFYYYRFLNGTNNGLQNVYNYTETLSPFMDLDFIEYCLHIPVKMRQNHALYKKWIISRYPQAAQFIWETIGCRIDSKIIKIAGKERHLAMIPNIIKGRLGLRRNGLDSQNHMNPVGYYITHNKELWEYLSGYFQYVEYIQDAEIKEMVEFIIRNGTAMEKIQLVTILSAIKMFFVSEDHLRRTC